MSRRGGSRGMSHKDGARSFAAAAGVEPFILSAQAMDAGFSLRAVAETGSTNADALVSLEDRLWVVADAQKGGRGRHGRVWHSPPGNLYASLSLLNPAPPEYAAQLGFVAGVALAQAVRALAPELAGALALKWPNDLLLDGAKLAGILLEGASGLGGLRVAIGIGVNIAHAPEVPGRKTTHLGARLPDLAPAQLFGALADTMAQALDTFDAGAGFADIRTLWLAQALAIGTKLAVCPGEERFEGTFGGIDSAGHLLLITPHGTQTLLAGDVFVLEG